MAIIAGVDIGNSTTEIVVTDGVVPLAWERRTTRGAKGSLASIRAAAALLAIIERKASVKVDQVVVAPWQPVTTNVTTIHEPAPDTGNIQIINCASHSVVGDDWAVGVPWNISNSPAAGVDLIAIVEANCGYKNAVKQINMAIEQGFLVVGVIAADDEAVLIASRLCRDIPVVDRADCNVALTARRLFIEVRPTGQCVSTATDVWALSTALKAEPKEIDAINLISRWIKDSNAVIIGLVDQSSPSSVATLMPSVSTVSGETVDIIEAIADMKKQLVGSICALNFEPPIKTSDVWGIDIDRILVDRGIRLSGHTHRMALASLSADNDHLNESLSGLFKVPVSVVDSESQAALIGTRTTPGLLDNTLILDIGGGTIDLVDESIGFFRRRWRRAAFRCGCRGSRCAARSSGLD